MTRRNLDSASGKKWKSKMKTRGVGREGNPSSTPPPQPVFVTTHWSVVLVAGSSDTPRARDALAKLCESYWYPLCD
jgi:RNA polymerase sigma-70 factor (ECF subfamily)